MHLFSPSLTQARVTCSESISGRCLFNCIWKPLLHVRSIFSAICFSFQSSLLLENGKIVLISSLWDYWFQATQNTLLRKLSSKHFFPSATFPTPSCKGKRIDPTCWTARRLKKAQSFKFLPCPSSNVKDNATQV